MEISASLPALPPVTLGSAAPDLQQAVALKLLKQSIDFQGQLALQLLPTPPAKDPSSPLGQNIDIHV